MRRAYILPAILLLGFSLRVAGLGFGLPNTYHQDEPIVVNHAMAIGVDGWNTKTYLPPQFASYFLFICYGAYFAIGHVFGLFPGKTDFALQFLKDPSAFYMIGRFMLGVVFGTATIYLLYRLAKKFFSEQTAVWASLFLSVSMLHAAHSHYVYMDIAVTFAVTLLFFCLYQWMEEPSLKNALAAGASFGFAVSVKYTAVYFFPVILLAFFIPAKMKVPLRTAAAHLFAAGLLSVAVYAVVSPYSFLDWQNFISQVRGQSAARGQQGMMHHLSYSLLNGTGMLFLYASLVGAFASWQGNRNRAALLILGISVYYAVNVVFSQPFARYMMPILPFLCVLAAEGTAALAGIVKKPAMSVIFASLVFTELLMPTLYFDFLLNTPDTRTECARWLESKVPEKSVIVLDNVFFGPRLLQTTGQIKEKYGYLGADAHGSAREKRLDLMIKAQETKKTFTVFYSLSEGQVTDNAFLFGRPLVKPEEADLKRIGAEYIVLNYSDPSAGLLAWKETMGKKLILAASFSPYKDLFLKSTGEFEGLTGPPDSRKDLFSRKTMGPYLEVYRIKTT